MYNTRLTALCPVLPRWAGTRKVKPIWILLKQETVSGSGISWAICQSARCSRQITTPAPHHSVFYRPDALPAAQPTASKHWRQFLVHVSTKISVLPSGSLSTLYLACFATPIRVDASWMDTCTLLTSVDHNAPTITLTCCGSVVQIVPTVVQ